MRAVIRKSFRGVGPLAFLLLVLGTPISFGDGGLLAPSRNLEGQQEPLARLTVVSEPPDLTVFLDGSEIGQTPIWLKTVKPGSHTLRVKQLEANVYATQGETLTLSFFKGSFVVVPPEREPLTAPEPEPKKRKERKKGVGPREERVPTDLTPWERFLNGSSPNF